MASIATANRNLATLEELKIGKRPKQQPGQLSLPLRSSIPSGPIIVDNRQVGMGRKRQCGGGLKSAFVHRDKYGAQLIPTIV